MLKERFVRAFYKQLNQPGQDRKTLMSRATPFFQRNKSTGLSTAFTFANSFLFALAVNDLINNQLVLVPWFSHFNLNLLDVSLFCKFFAFLKHACRYLSAMFTLMYTIQRFASVSDPVSTFQRNQASAFKSGKINLVLIASSFLVYSYTIVVFSSKDRVLHDETSAQCEFSEQHSNLIKILENTLDLVLSGIVPMVGIVSLNSITCYRLTRIDKDLQSIGKSDTVRVNFHVRRRDASTLSNFESLQSSFASYTKLNVQKDSMMAFGQFQRRRNASCRIMDDWAIRAEKLRLKKFTDIRRATLTLVIVSFTFVALNLPSRVTQLYSFLADSSLHALDRRAGKQRGHSSLEDVFENVSSLSFTVNFFLYFMMAKKFRNALKSLFSIFI